MPNVLVEIQEALKGAIGKAAAYTAGLKHRPYAVSAVLISSGSALTASHVIGDDGAELILPDGGEARAELAGRDPVHDLALLRLSTKADFAAPAAAAAVVGDVALVLKRDPFDGINAVLSMVSSAGANLRLGGNGAVERYIQVAADRMPGSTGGPVADAEGRLAGIQVFGRRMGHEIAIPAGLALERAALLREKGSVKRPYLGIKSQIVRLPPAVREALSGRQETGLLVLDAAEDSPAARGGLSVGDILVGFGGTNVTDHETLISAMVEHGAGAVIQAEVSRGGAVSGLQIAIGGV